MHTSVDLMCLQQFLYHIWVAFVRYEPMFTQATRCKKVKNNRSICEIFEKFSLFFCQFFEWKSLSKWLYNLLVEQTKFFIGIISFVNTRTVTSAKHRQNWQTEQTVFERVREKPTCFGFVTCVLCCVVCSLVFQCLLRSKFSCCVRLKCFDIYLVW